MKRHIAFALVLMLAQAWGAEDTTEPVRLSVHARFANTLADLLYPGDTVYAIATRVPAPRSTNVRARPNPVWSEQKFGEALDELAAVEVRGVQRTLVFSAYEDLEREIARLPEGIDTIAYNTETSMTPEAELARIREVVPRFAELCHNHGYRMTWGPTHLMITREPDLFELARYVDGIGLQHQRTLQIDGQDAFETLTKERFALIKSINPDCSVTVQVALGRTSASDAATALLAIAGSCDRFSAWTLRDPAGLRELLVRLRPPGQEPGQP